MVECRWLVLSYTQFQQFMECHSLRSLTSRFRILAFGMFRAAHNLRGV